MNNADTTFYFFQVPGGDMNMEVSMRKIIYKAGAIAIVCIIIILLISLLPTLGNGTGIKPIMEQIKDGDYQLSHMPVLGPAYVSGKVTLKEKISSKFNNITKNNTSSSSSVENVKLIPVTFQRFEDAITFVATDKSGNEMHIRLYGLIAPGNITTEDGTQLDVKALNYSSSLISSSETVWIEIAEEQYDEFDRTLCYAWLNDNTYDIHKCMNAILADEGYVTVAEKDFKYRKTLSQMSEEARTAGRGLWYYPEYK